MIPLIEDNRDVILALCHKHHVARLDVFGSAVSGKFDPARSDLDVLVEFESLEPGQLADAYFGLLHDLEDLFDRRVDLVSPKAIRNPYFQRDIQQTREAVYAA
ncbi:MAG: nucleotidyltransferase domain-containing protein [Phycisphaerae bacterium]|nr:nucleotidyltransferase domain-containing protein [Phycisphaerae bacterium]